jgi:tRNA A-37 threonylcarbamoyl transferase component Bud32
MNEARVREPGTESHTQVRRGATIGRYVVLGWVGNGAMGDVYSAYDPDLDRKLAIKLLRVKRGSSVGGLDGKTRLLREAQAIAKLSHPNVVVVHDVGTFEDRVFIAMEFIEGGTLSFWLHAQQRTWREILRVFIAAGGGLQHAHEANLVHRDFKPDNVMVRVDGDVRVMDFGLVRYIDVIDNETEADVDPNSPLANLPMGPEQPVRGAFALDATVDLAKPPPLPAVAAQAVQTKLTQTGVVLGTPAYMAPEQFVGQTVDARTDQFSFCVALYEALFGVRPFDGATMSELTGNVLAGHVKPTPQRSQVPLAVSRALRRGLSVAPADRYPSMTGLLADLERYARPRANVVMGMAAGFVVLAALVGGLVWREIDRESLCAVPADRFEGVWETSGRNGSRRAAIEFMFRTAGQENARTLSTGRSTSWGWANNRSRVSFTSAAHMLDKYVGDWLSTYKDACEATNYRKDQSAQVLDLRMSCLNDRFNELRGLSEMLVAPSSHLIENAGEAVAALGPVDKCSNVDVLRSTSRSPSK